MSPGKDTSSATNGVQSLADTVDSPSDDVRSARGKWPKILLVGGHTRLVDQATYNHNRVHLKSRELDVVSRLTLSTTHEDWIQSLQEASGSKMIDNPTAMKFDERYRELGLALKAEAGCDDHRMCMVKQYTRDYWPQPVTGSTGTYMYVDSTKTVRGALPPSDGQSTGTAPSTSNQY